MNPVETISEYKVSKLPIENENSDSDQTDQPQFSDAEDDLPEMSTLKYLHTFLTLARKIPLHINKL